MSKLLAMMMKPKNYMYATVKGSLTENNGVFSGFSENNYLSLQQDFSLTPTTKAEFVVRVSNTEFDGSSSFLGDLNANTFNIRFNSGKKIALYLGDGNSWIVNGLTGTTSFQVDTFYYIKLTFDNGVITIYSSTDKTTWTQEATTTYSITYTYNLVFGRARTNLSYQKGSIDFNQSYIKINNTKYNLQAVVGYTVVGSPTITDGVVSGFSSSDYLTIPNVTDDIKNSYKTNFEMQVKVVLSSTLASSQVIYFPYKGTYNGIRIAGSGKIQWYMYSGTYTITTDVNTVLPNNTYYIKTKIKNSLAELLISNNGTTWTSLATLDLTDMPTDYTSTNYCRIGVNGATTVGDAFNGSIDMKETYIKINNKLWFNGQPAE